MQKVIKYLIFSLLFFGLSDGFAQDLKTSITKNKELDSLRKKDEGSADSVIFTAKYIRYTTHKLTKDSIQTLAIDTGLAGIQNFSVLSQPRMPTVGTGVLGTAAMPLLFEPVKTIGFDAGFHALDFYALNHQDVKFYRARAPFTNLYYVNGAGNEQVLKLTHSQNINKNWNIGANFNRIGTNGFYTRQRGDHLNAAIFTWYQSTNKRYNLWFDAIFNTLKAQENGSIVNDNIFSADYNSLVDKKAESVKLNRARQLWRKNSFMLKQSYFVGRIDSSQKSSSQNILPTNKITHSLTYTKNAFSFKKDEIDFFKVLPRGTLDSVFTNDSTQVNHLQNEFIYSFFLRAKGSTFVKNEFKIDAGIKHDFYNFGQFSLARNLARLQSFQNSFQNISLVGALGYRFSNNVDFNLDLQQIFQGRNTGDFLYEAKSNFLLGKNAGRIVLAAYLQNKSPEEIFNRYFGNHHRWTTNFDRTKTANFTFTYLNEKYNLDVNASYYLISNHLYFGANTGSLNQILPLQATSDINLFKLSLGKKMRFKSFHLDSYLVYQNTDNEEILRMPDFYTFNSFYKDQTLFKTLKLQLGFDVRYNTTFVAMSYSPAASQFYNGENITFSSKPVVDVWVKAGLKRANVFLKYDYANQDLLSRGFYTVNRYPMPDRLLKFGVSWNFYD
jgi:hypothetical protein